MYPYPTSPLAEGPPVRYPLDYPLCYSRLGGGTIIVPLRIRLYSASVPDPMQVMSLRKKDPAADGCFTESYARNPARPDVLKIDRYGGGSNGWQSLDMSGNGYFSSVAYMSQLLNADDLRKEAEHEAQKAQHRVQNLAKFGQAQVETVEQDEVVIVNGLKWRHRLIARYDTPDLSIPSKGKLTSWRDIYEHRIDEAHILRRTGRYDAMVVADAEWINARRELTRKLVDAVRIEKMSSAEVEAAVVEWDRQSPLERTGRRKGP